ncbi:hypothetical protein QAD02_015570 [Eretmocerus hayati]|uniref:Uncharacterized protein n=1 Tax=Eretmocerus hayati TaxID=131215 RepID=A0ACC2P9L3_9HYME|nr:hypothetical protein QAD02_015570 [Eretmocerus hayati]
MSQQIEPVLNNNAPASSQAPLQSSAHKRPPPPSTESGSSIDPDEPTSHSPPINEVAIQENDDFQVQRRKRGRNKKPRVEPPVPMSEADISSILSEARAKLDLANSAEPLEFEKFEQFMIESRGSKNVVELAASFSDKIENLTSKIDLIYPYINNPVLKSRCTKLKKKLLPNEKGGSDTELDTSSRSDHDSQ